MNYITAEQFLSLDVEVQKVFTDWWEPKMYDLFFAQLVEFGNIKSYVEDNHTLKALLKSKGVSRFPLFQLEQLWEFVEDMTNEYVVVDFMADEYIIKTTCTEEILAWESDDKIKSFWTAAVKVASGNWRSKD